ncbi:histidine kinase [Virgisporangium aliadipatigenens]|uniref:Histidine kinase n=1 Tax=Virgisporangium aliadipatigenens TaxID=741659 RepID=A0A8J3YK84_9ACTN|nr:sensor histidine kinase [Virgisporangium aliadipatigenens]GIJ45456.1 histidine kinase [Virgisporangium aliadipatigenens]
MTPAVDDPLRAGTGETPAGAAAAPAPLGFAAARSGTRAGRRDARATLRRALAVLPYVLLAGSTAVALVVPGRAAADRLVTLGVAALAAAWVFAAYTSRPAAWRARTGPMLAYLGGQLAIAGVLTARQQVFIAFAVVGFVQAHELLPAGWAFGLVLATSVVINVVPDGLPGDPDRLALVFTVIVLQTLLIGWFGQLGFRSDRESAERRRVVIALEQALAENAGLHAQLLVQAREAGVHDERQRMAREIHDTLAQGLAGIVAQSQAARRSPGERGEHLERIEALARDSLAAARRSVAALGPPELDGTRLPEAVAGLAARWSHTAHVAVHVETAGEPRQLLTDVEVALFRVAQEALANVARHANATRAAVTLTYLDDVVLLDVRDDGDGFDPDAARPERYGLRVIRQRVERVGGTLAVESAAGDGTVVNASVPALTERE